MKTIQALEQQGIVWKAGYADDFASHYADSNRSTGFDSLDQELLIKGWPTRCVIELLLANHGIGELSLFLPWLGRMAKSTDKKVAFINPPYLPSVSCFVAQGVMPQQIWLLSPKGDKESLWLQQQCLLEGHCFAVFMWHNDKTSDTALRKLQLAAKQGDCLGISIRSQRVKDQSSPAPYRLLLEHRGSQRAQVQIIKRRGGWSSSPIPIKLGALIDPVKADTPIQLIKQ